MKNFKFQWINCQFILVVLVGLALSSCAGFGGGENNNAPEFRLSDLQGLWLQEQDTTEHYVRFTNEKADEEGYFFGREWNEYHGGDEAVYEKDLYVYKKDTAGNDSLIHGNGWFQYQLELKGDLHEIHFMDNGGADIPKEYIVSKLNSTTLEYYEKDRKNNTFLFSRIVETKK